MVAYALVGFLDSKTDNNFKRLWKDLSEKTLLNMVLKIKEENHILQLRIMII